MSARSRGRAWEWGAEEEEANGRTRNGGDRLLAASPARVLK